MKNLLDTKNIEKLNLINKNRELTEKFTNAYNFLRIYIDETGPRSVLKINGRISLEIEKCKMIVFSINATGHFVTHFSTNNIEEIVNYLADKEKFYPLN